MGPEGEKGMEKLCYFFMSFFMSPPAGICFMDVSIFLDVSGGGGGGAGVGAGAAGAVVVESILALSDFFEHEDIPPTNNANAPSTMSLRSLMAIYLLV